MNIKKINKKSVIIYGAGNAGRQVCDLILNNNNNANIYFIFYKKKKIIKKNKKKNNLFKRDFETFRQFNII